MGTARDRARNPEILILRRESVSLNLQVGYAKGMLISSIVSVTSMALISPPTWHDADFSIQSLVTR